MRGQLRSIGDYFVDHALLLSGAINENIGVTLVLQGNICEETCRESLRALIKEHPFLFTENTQEASACLDSHNETSKKLGSVFSIMQSSEPAKDSEDFHKKPLKSDGSAIRLLLIRSDDQSVINVKASHQVIDAKGLLSLVYIFCDLLRNTGLASRSYPPLDLTRIFKKAYSQSTPRERLNGLKSVCTGLPVADLSFKDQPEAHSIAHDFEKGYSSVHIGRESFSKLVQLARVHQVTINDCLISAYYRSLWDLLPSTYDECIQLIMTCDLRRAILGDLAQTLATNCSALWHIGINRLSEHPSATLERVSRATSEWKQKEGRKNLALGFGLLENLLFEANPDRANMLLQTMELGFRNIINSKKAELIPMLTNIGKLELQWMQLDEGVSVKDIQFYPPIAKMPLCCVGAFTFNNNLFLRIGYEGQWQHHFADRLLQSLSCNLLMTIDD